MTGSDRDTSSDGDHGRLSVRVAAAAIRDAIDALEGERPDLAERLRALLERIEGGADE